ncbi:60S ribosomal protein L36 [Sigmodon hispidus]
MALHYPMAVGLNQQGPQGDKEREQAEAQPAPWAPHQAHQVRADMIGEVCHGAAQGVQRQARAQVHQEEGGGMHIRAKRKREELSNVLAAMRKAAKKD